ncbi:hypothetical protein [Salegentibacter chungangensis]|uniref:Uncharacterized protein n=1 Tax=Salegentibacter chungangensis TaxID=1335724 RepID=A0ABW3NRG2_9FLAO
MRLRPFLLGIIILVFEACYSDKDDNINRSDCEQLACTEEFRTITVSVQNSDGEPVALDSIKVVIQENDKDITETLIGDGFERYQESGSYPVFNDLFTAEYRNDEVNISFSGFLSEEEVVSAIYKAGADCCHVYLISGETNLVLE